MESPLGVLVRVAVNVGFGVLVRVGVCEGVTEAVGPDGVFVRVDVLVGPTGVFVRVGVADGATVDVGTGVPPGALPQAREPLMYAGTVGQSV